MLTGVEPTRRSAGRSGSAVKISIARLERYGDWPGPVMSAPRAALPSWTPGPSPSTPRTRTSRRRDRYSADFRPTPYDVWSFRHDRAFGIPHPGAIPPAIVAHTLHYFTLPDALVVDPWPAAAPRSMSASQWDDVAWLTTFTQLAQRSVSTISAMAFQPRRPAAT